MWRPGAAIAALLLVVFSASFFGGGEQRRMPVQQEEASALTSSTDRAEVVSARGCGRALIRDSADNGQIDHSYARRCYESALRLVPEDGPIPEALLTALKGPSGY
jgi:hypothetical protein